MNKAACRRWTASGVALHPPWRSRTIRCLLAACLGLGLSAFLSAQVVSSGGGAPSGSSGHKGYDYSTARVSEQAEIFQVGYGSYVLHCLGSIEDADGEVSNLHLRGLVSPIVVERRTYFLGAGHVFDLRKEMSTLGYSLAASISRPPEYYLERDGRRYDLVRVDTGTRDMALFVAREGQADFPRSRYACGDSDDVRVGNAVLTWGRPLMESFELSAGIVAALAAPPSLRAASFLEAAAEDFFVTSMPTIFGSSGALVYAFRGGEPEIVGMLVAGYVNINRSIVYKINAILRESGLRR